VCDARWADESVYDWGALEYPDIETDWAKVKGLEQLNWRRHGQSIMSNAQREIADVLAVEHQWTAAHLQDDVATIGHIMADDFLRIQPKVLSQRNMLPSRLSSAAHVRRWECCTVIVSDG
jgi:hypothetical protein